jgi:hypothetical protein
MSDDRANAPVSIQSQSQPKYKCPIERLLRWRKLVTTNHVGLRG